MNIEQKNQLIEQYINELVLSINSKYVGLITDEKKKKAIEMFKDSNGDLKSEIIPKINEIANQMIEDFVMFQNHLAKFTGNNQLWKSRELASLQLNTSKNGIYLSQQQIDLLMITELKSKEELKNYVENICGQFPNMTVEDIVSNYRSIQTLDELEEAKKELYKKYQDSLISYLDNAKMNSIEQAKVKLEKLGITAQEQDACLSFISQGKIEDVYKYLQQRHGVDFITQFNRYMKDDFENVKSVSYEEMKSLSNLISNDQSIDTIIIATGKFDNTIYQSSNGKVFDPYLTEKALYYCMSHNKHMRYHALFDQSHVDNLLRQGKGLKNHDKILAEMKFFVKKSIDFIEENNKQLADGSKVINTVEIFNELVEKNKSNKDSSYDMVWEKNFGITIDEIISCFDDIKKPVGVEFMYNETTLTESQRKRDKVEEVLFEIDKLSPNLIDSFGDQMHLSDEDVMTEKGKQNLVETAKMLKRIQDGKLLIDGEIKTIKSKKTECTEHDFHFENEFLNNYEIAKNNGNVSSLWNIKRNMQDYIGDCYLSNGVEFQRSTYWTLFGRNDHSLVRNNIKFAKETNKPLLSSMQAGIIRDGTTFDGIKSLDTNKSMPLYIEKEQNYNKTQQLKNKTFVKTMSNNKFSSDNGFTNYLALILFIGLTIGMIFTHLLIG